MPLDWDPHRPPPPPGVPPPALNPPAPTTGSPHVGETGVRDGSHRGVSRDASPFVPSTLATRKTVISNRAMSNDEGRDPGQSRNSSPQFLPKQQPNAAAAPFIPGASFKASAAPFVPGGASGSITTSGEEFKLPSDDDFTLGLTDSSMKAHVSGAPGKTPQYAGRSGGTGGVRADAQPSPRLPAPFGGGANQVLLPTQKPVMNNTPTSITSGQAQLSTRFASEHLHAELRQRAFLEHAQIDPASEAAADLPKLTKVEPSYALGLHSAVLKGISSVDGLAYALRRFDHRRVAPNPELTAAAREAVDRWAPFHGHPHIAALRGTFVSADMWGSAALYFAHDYHAGASSLESIHCEVGDGRKPASESQLWSYASQLCCVLRAVHAAGLAVGGASTLSPSKILACPSSATTIDGPMNGEPRIRLAAVGIVDVLRPELVGKVNVHGNGVSFAQREDLRAMGKLLAVLACGPTRSPMTDPISVAQHRCSQPLGRLITGLISDAITDCGMLTQLLAPVALDSLEAARAWNDQLKVELAKELENGRLLRLLVKLAFVNERPDGDMDTQWAETGDRYILKLFRDFVFHQHNDEGAPVLDWGHVFESLNKLDVGVSEKVLLLSRDELSMLVASYADVKRCVDSAYTELVQASSAGNVNSRGWQQQREGPGQFYIQ